MLTTTTFEGILWNMSFLYLYDYVPVSTPFKLKIYLRNDNKEVREESCFDWRSTGGIPEILYISYICNNESEQELLREESFTWEKILFAIIEKCFVVQELSVHRRFCLTVKSFILEFFVSFPPNSINVLSQIRLQTISWNSSWNCLILHQVLIMNVISL